MERLSDPAVGELTSLIGGLFADPNLAVVGARYYLFPTTDGTSNWSARSFSAFSSSDLLNWESHGVILALGKHVAWAQNNAWAPAFAAHDGSYYFYYTAESNIGVAKSDDPLGPYVDLGRPLIAAGDYSGRAIDPSVFVDDDGSSYLYWGNHHAHGVRLNDDMMSFDPTQVVTWVPTDFREAPWVHKRNGIYFLSWSVGDTRDENYRVCYASGPGPLGPWTDNGELLEKSPQHGILGTGHHSIVNVPGSDEWIIAYHRFAIPGGDGFHREIAFDRLVHRGEHIERVVPTHAAIKMPLSATTQSTEPTR